MKASLASIVRSKFQYIGYQRDTARIIRKVLKQDSCCVDIGCHKGKFLEVMIRRAPHGTHYAFEPLPSMFDHLLEKFGKEKHVHLSPVALSDTEGKAEFFHVVNSPGYSGLKERDYDGKEPAIDRIMVDTGRLDNIIPREINIDLVKMVVEGAELQVLKGALQTIRRNKPVIIYESGLGAADRYGTSPDEIYRFLSYECGYKITTPRGYLTDKRCFSEAEYSSQFYERENYYFVAFP